MKFSESLKKTSDFRSIYKSGRSCANKYLVMYVKENNLEKNRIGISVSKKVGNSVVRHRLTRLVREAYRLSEEKYMKGLDIIVIARVNAKDCTYRQIESAIYHLSKMHNIMEDKNEVCDD